MDSILVAKVCVITPIYATDSNGRIDLIRESYYSLQNQTLKEFVWLIVDDGSLVDINNAFEEILEDQRIVIIRREKRGGERATASNPQNRGVEEVLTNKRLQKIPYVTVLDSDDLLTPTSLEHRVQMMDENPNAGMIYTSIDLFYPKSGYLRTKEAYLHAQDLQSLRIHVWWYFVPYMSLMWRKDFLIDVNNQLDYPNKPRFGIWDPQITYGEDRESTLQCIRTVQKTDWTVLSSQEVTAKQRLHQQSITGEFRESRLKQNVRNADHNLIRERHYIDLSSREIRLLLSRDWLSRNKYIPEIVKGSLRHIRDRFKGHY